MVVEHSKLSYWQLVTLSSELESLGQSNLSSSNPNWGRSRHEAANLVAFGAVWGTMAMKRVAMSTKLISSSLSN